MSFALQFHILGAIQLRADGRPVDIGSAKERCLLGVLLFFAGKSVSIRTLLEALWDGEPPAKAEYNLQSYVSRLRTTLKLVAPDCVIERKQDGYHLSIDPSIIDLFQVRSLRETATRAITTQDYRSAGELTRQALALAHEPALADLRTQWATRRREGLAEEMLQLWYVLLEAELHCGNANFVLTETHTLLEQHESNETLIGFRLRALHASGRHFEATQYYLQVYDQMVRHSGSTPGPRLRQLNDQLIQASMDDNPTRPDPTGPASVEPILPVPQQLPPDSRVIGRDAELGALDRLLLPLESIDTAVRIAALIGAPGIGKSALALHWAHRVRHHFPDGQLFADLNGYGPTAPTPSGDVVAGFLEALGIPAARIPARVEDRTAMLRSITSQRRMLLVLDNIPSSTAAVPLLPSSAHCAVLITSRARLTNLASRHDAHLITLSHFDDHRAVALLAQVIGPDRVARSPESLRALAAHCGGLPLALRLCGEHVAARPHAPLLELAEQFGNVEDAFDVLDSDGDEAITPSIAFSWSYQALEGDMSRLFRLLGLLPGTDLCAAAAGALAGLTVAAARRQLDALTARHLLEHRGNDRYHFHDLIRLYAHRLCQREDTPEQRRSARRRVLDWYLRTSHHADRSLTPSRPATPLIPTTADIVPLTFPDDDHARRWFLRERHNLAAAVNAAAQHDFPEHAWQLPAALREMYERYDYLSDALALHQSALDAAKQSRDPQAVPYTLNGLGVIQRKLGLLQQAHKSFSTAHTEFIRLQDHLHQATCLHNLGMVELDRANYTTATELLHEALRLRQRLQDRWGQGHTLHSLGTAYRHNDRYAEARTHYTRALAVRNEISHWHGVGTTTTELAAMHAALGEHDEALLCCWRALQIHERTHDRRRTISALNTLAAIHCELGEWNLAARAARKVVHLCGSDGDRWGTAQALDTLGRAYRSTNRPEAAGEAWTEAASIYQELNDPRAQRILTRLSTLDETVT